MKVNSITNNTFKGYDARPIRGFLMNSNCYGIADEMYKIGQREGFKIYSPYGRTGERCAEILPPKCDVIVGLWAQDYWTVVKNKLLTLDVDAASESIKKFFMLKDDFTQRIARETPEFKQLNQDLWGLFADIARTNQSDFKEVFSQKKEELCESLHRAHISGGNVFMVKDGKKNCVLIGNDELIKYNIDEMQAMYDADEVILLPQMDYHLDLFIRPLDKKRILIADDNMSVNILYDGLSKFKRYLDKLSSGKSHMYYTKYNTLLKFIKNFENEISHNGYADTDEVEEILEDYGFDVIRVPGRIYEIAESVNNEDLLRSFCNYLNANVFLNDDNELVYITNKSNIDERLGLSREMCRKIGFSFEKSFYESISKYVKPEHFYLVDGEEDFISRRMLTEFQGGIHCVCSEIPKDCK